MLTYNAEFSQIVKSQICFYNLLLRNGITPPIPQTEAGKEIYKAAIGPAREISDKQQHTAAIKAAEDRRQAELSSADLAPIARHKLEQAAKRDKTICPDDAARELFAKAFDVLRPRREQALKDEQD